MRTRHLRFLFHPGKFIYVDSLLAVLHTFLVISFFFSQVTARAAQTQEARPHYHQHTIIHVIFADFFQRQVLRRVTMISAF